MSIQQNKFKAIADTIRACLGTGDAISPSSFAEKVSAVNETAYDKGYEKGLEEADGVKMACGYAQGKNTGDFSISGLSFKPKDIRILTFGDVLGTYRIKNVVWKESVGGKCHTTDGYNDNDALNDAIVTTTDDGFSARSGGTKTATFSKEYYFYWFAFAEEQEGGYV